MNMHWVFSLTSCSTLFSKLNLQADLIEIVFLEICCWWNQFITWAHVFISRQTPSCKEEHLQNKKAVLQKSVQGIKKRTNGLFEFLDEQMGGGRNTSRVVAAVHSLWEDLLERKQRIKVHLISDRSLSIIFGVISAVQKSWGRSGSREDRNSASLCSGGKEGLDTEE